MAHLEAHRPPTRSSTAALTTLHTGPEWSHMHGHVRTDALRAREISAYVRARNNNTARVNGSMVQSGTAPCTTSHAVRTTFHYTPAPHHTRVACMQQTKNPTSPPQTTPPHTRPPHPSSSHHAHLKPPPPPLSSALLSSGSGIPGPTKKVTNVIFGTEGTLTYNGNSPPSGAPDPESGALALQRHDGREQTFPGFYYENLQEDGYGPESLQAFISGCRGGPFFNAADATVGLRAVLTIDAMYRSAQSGRAEDVLAAP